MKAAEKISKWQKKIVSYKFGFIGLLIILLIIIAIYMYSKICNLFERDPKYGPLFVKTHQELISELVKISMNKLIHTEKKVD